VDTAEVQVTKIFEQRLYGQETDVRSDFTKVIYTRLAMLTILY